MLARSPPSQAPVRLFAGFRAQVAAVRQVARCRAGRVSPAHRACANGGERKPRASLYCAAEELAPNGGDAGDKKSDEAKS